MDKNFAWKENLDLIVQITAFWPWKPKISSIFWKLFPLFYSEKMNKKKWKTFWFCLKKKFNLAHFKIYWLSKNSHILPKSRLFCCKGFFLFLEVPTKQDNWLCSWFSLWWCFSAWTLPVSKPVNQYFYLCINTILSCAFSHFIAK